MDKVVESRDENLPNRTSVGKEGNPGIDTGG